MALLTQVYTQYALTCRVVSIEVCEFCPFSHLSVDPEFAPVGSPSDAENTRLP